MKVPFTKMHGAGNDFVVLDATRTPLALDAAQLKRLGDRRFGVGADQILVVERQRRARRVEHDEVVAGAVHLAEAQRDG